MDRFCCQVHNSNGSVVLAVSGDVDMAVHKELSSEVAQHLSAGAQVVLDCSRITFLDSMGLSALLELHRRAGLVGARMVLAALPELVTRVLHLSGTQGCFEIAEGWSTVVDSRTSGAGQPPTACGERTGT